MAALQYPFSPALLDALPEELVKLFRSLETKLLEEICSRLNIADQLNEVTVQDIRALRSHGIDLSDIETQIAKASGVSQKRLSDLFDDVVRRNQRYYSQLADLAKVTTPETIVTEEDIESIRRQTWSAFENITGSMGFLTIESGRLTLLPPAKAYWWALDNAEMQIQSGAMSYNEAIYGAVRQLADSGIRTVDYESGHVDQVDVAVRRAVMTGTSQLCAKYTERSAAFLGTDLFEVSAHAGARDKPGPSPWSSHKDWQGRVYTTNPGNTKYPNIYTVCGLGEVDGLEGINCRHRRWAFVDGVSERTYTDEQLAHIDDGLGCTFEGKKYTSYEATQKQRQLERAIRKAKRQEASFSAAGLTDKAQNASIRLKRLETKYRQFSKAAHLPEQWERARAYAPRKGAGSG